MNYPYSAHPIFPPTKKLFGSGLYLGLESPPVSASTNPARSLAASQTEAKASHWQLIATMFNHPRSRVIFC